MSSDAAGKASASDPKPTLNERWFARRNQLLAHPKFQRWASSFPLTRPVAANRASDLFDICAGFVYSQILFACVELKLFEKLADGPLATDALAAQCDLKPDALARLLDAATALNLTERRGDDQHGLGVHGAAYLGNPGIGAMIAHHAMFYRDLADPLALIRGEKNTELSQFWPYATSSDPGRLEADAVGPYSELMSASQALIADDVLDAYPFVDHACLLDIGGGGGDFLIAAAHRRPDLKMMLFDLPAVADRAKQRFADERLDGRATAIGGDFKRDPLPDGADLISLVRVAHDLDDDALNALFTKVFATLPPGGILLLAEPMAETPHAEKVGAYFSMYLLAMQRGRPRTFSELSDRLYGTGFARVRCIATSRPLLTSLLVAQKSAGPRNRSVRRN